MKAGSEVCVTVTLLDSLVLARAAFFHSMNYRSVVVFGKPEVKLPGLDSCLLLGNACKGLGMCLMKYHSESRSLPSLHAASHMSMFIIASAMPKDHLHSCKLQQNALF